tara:strand:+ start:33930 stop:34754 length:825 start_codon:yes stop_codon:yes gene_type:complete
MESKSKNLILSSLVVIFFGSGAYYFWNLEQRDLDSNIVKVHEEIVIKDFKLPSQTSNQIVERPFYTFSYNEEAEQPDWIAYTLYPFPDSLRVKRKDNFRTDPLVTSGSASLKDYKSSGYDRGHLAPAKALSYSKEAMNASFYLSNMSPQIGIGFNRGIWKKIEARIFEWSNQSDSLYVVTGPILDNPLGTIGENKVLVPRAYYKTVFRFKDDSISGIGFLIDHKKFPNGTKITNFLTSIDSIEKVSGINFYHQMDSVQQAKIEMNKELVKFIKE